MSFKKRYYLHGLEEDDWYQEARIKLFQTMNQYDETKGYTFGNFYKMKLKHHIFGLIRRQQAYKRKSDRESLQSSEDGEEDFQEKNLEKDETISEIILAESVTRYLLVLSSFEEKVLVAYMRGKTITEISMLLGRSHLQTKNALARCRQKLHACIEEN